MRAIVLSEESDMDLVLADAEVRATLDRLAALPSLSAQTLRSFLPGRDRGDAPPLHRRESDVIKFALWGDDSFAGPQLNMVNFLLRSAKARADLLRGVLPPALLGMGGGYAIEWMGMALEGGEAAALKGGEAVAVS
mmetsp:Transcript_440/g.893  ORF Transcript_440/g.893 Transcript_440/m.893 type:complete len:136 (-) Transcript_440:26-433(-)